MCRRLCLRLLVRDADKNPFSNFAKCYKIKNLSDEEATLLEPASCAIHGMDKLKMPFGAKVLLIGAGPTGLILAQLMKIGGAGHITIAANKGESSPFSCPRRWTERERHSGLTNVPQVSRWILPDRSTLPTPTLTSTGRTPRSSGPRSRRRTLVSCNPSKGVRGCGSKMLTSRGRRFRRCRRVHRCRVDRPGRHQLCRPRRNPPRVRCLRRQRPSLVVANQDLCRRDPNHWLLLPDVLFPQGY